MRCERAGSEMKYYNWRITTSIDYTPSNIDKKCVMVNPNSDYTWIDEHCNVEAYFICMTGRPTVLLGCPPWPGDH